MIEATTVRAGTCLIVLLAAGAANAAPPAEILVPGTELYTESITSTADGTVYIGAMGPGAIFRAAPGADMAEPWIEPGTDGLASVLGVFADDKAETLWVRSFTRAPEGVTPPRSTLHAFGLSTDELFAKWPLPTENAVCNDIAVGPDGTVYVSDTENMEVVALKHGWQALEVWAGGGDFGPKGGVLDGIAVVDGHVVVNALRTSRLFSVPIRPDGSAGPVAEVALDRPLEEPDGQRSIGESSILIVDAGEGGRLMRIDLAGEKLDKGTVSTLQSGFADGPVSVTVVGDTAYVIEAQFKTAKEPPVKPFKAKAVPLTRQEEDR